MSTAHTEAPRIRPRLLRAREAAEYLALPVAGFLRLGIGKVHLGSRVRYDLVALDEWLNEQRGRSTETRPTSEDDADAALARFSFSFERPSGRS